MFIIIYIVDLYLLSYVLVSDRSKPNIMRGNIENTEIQNIKSDQTIKDETSAM